MTYTQYQALIAAYLEDGSLTESPETIAAAAEGNIKKLVEIAGGNMSAFSRTYGIPLRTVQDWCTGRAKPGEYIPRLIGYTLLQASKEEAIALRERAEQELFANFLAWYDAFKSPDKNKK